MLPSGAGGIMIESTVYATKAMNTDQSYRASKLEVILRWTARIWGVGSTLLLLAFAFGGRENLRFTPSEFIAFLLFPIGAIVGFAVAWRRELLGGLIATVTFALFVVYLFAVSGRWPINVYFLALIAPGFIHLANAIFVARRPK